MMSTTKDAQRNLTAVDVMTSPVEVVGPTADVREVANLMLTRRISGIPVVSEHGEILGIVTEGDLLHKETADATPRTAFGEATAERPARIEKSHGVTVGDLMTTPVITVGDDASVREIAELMLRKRIKRIPVVRNGRLVGIVSRADVLRGLVRPDEAVATAVRQVLRDGVRIDLSHLRFWVRNGVVSLEGVVESRCERELARRVVEAIDGVVQIDDRITCRVAD
ncbi:MAG TPA: CBS domain-containing protein [bacterium]|nr:CBS domain-containing protein [bacterium]